MGGDFGGRGDRTGRYTGQGVIVQLCPSSILLGPQRSHLRDELTQNRNGIFEEVFFLSFPQVAEELPPRAKRLSDSLPTTDEDHLLFLGQKEVNGVGSGSWTHRSGQEGGCDLRETDL